MKIYDCFQFFNELDLLEIRLELLYDHVDHFVISETTRTHSDLPKPLYFQENKQKFEKYLDKIIHIVNDYPDDILNMGKKDGNDPHSLQYNIISERYDIEENEGQLKRYPTFCRDYLQKEYIKFGLLDCNDDDLIMISDLDEFPNPIYVDKIKKENLYNTVIMQDCFYYHINTLAHTNWYGNYIVKYSDTKNVSLTHLKNKRVDFNKIFKGGWHFSFMGGVDRVKTKIMSYAHQEFNNSNILNNVESRIENKLDVFNRPSYNDPLQEFYFSGMIDVELSSFPNNMIEFIKQKYKYLIKE
jgi:beta-1,4-mannosyl-glycoprotein beta-1,4-N-acetylglucosaminyltransferase